MQNQDLSVLIAHPKAGYLAHKEEIDAAVHEVLERGWYILGSQVSCFEAEFARYVGVQFCVGVGSGTDAIQIALLACGVGQGDAVVTVSHTAVATVAAIDLVGATPILVDIDPISFTMDTACLEKTIRFHEGSKIKAIIPVHLYGHPADMACIMEIAGRYNLYVIEDCAQAHGAIYNGRMCGSFADIGAFSFYPTKNLGAFGDAGAVVTNDAQLADKLRMLRQYGWEQRYISRIPGMNTRLDEMQAAILRVKLRYLEEDNERRRRVAHRYNAALAGTALILPEAWGNVKHVYHQYVVRSDLRDDLKTFLKSKSIETAILYPMPVHMQPGYRERVVVSGDGLMQTEAVCRQILSLPIYPELTDEHSQRTIDAIHEWKEN